MNQTSLADIKRGERCIVLDVATEPAEMRSRLFALGVIPGSALEVLRFAPLGDPMQVKVSGSYISIRKAEAEIILVETQ
ncbi:MAG: FeoA family protein [Gammaproteobacteria bacterium]